MERLTVKVGEIAATFDIPMPAPRKSAFAFCLHKAGSIMLDEIICQIAEAARIPALNFPSTAFLQGVPQSALTRDDIGPFLMRDGYIFTGFRFLPDFLPKEALDGRRKVLLIRDPRDMLVSLYFSHLYSHYVPDRGPVRDSLLASRAQMGLIDIDTFVLSEKAEKICADYRAYMRIVGADWRVYRYEDIIFRKRAWIADLTEYLDIRLRWWRRNRIADRNDLRPAREDVNSHVRQVTPGNYKKALRPETITVLDARIQDILQFHQTQSASLR